MNNNKFKLSVVLLILLILTVAGFIFKNTRSSQV